MIAKTKDTLLKLLRLSVEENNLVSSARMQSYLVLAGILTAAFTSCTIEVVNAFRSWTTHEVYKISNEFIVIFGMLLSHHLGILFSRKDPAPPVTTPAQNDLGTVVYKNTSEQVVYHNPEQQAKDKAEEDAAAEAI